MKSEQEIRKELETTKKDIKINLKLLKAEFDNGHTLSANAHTEYHSRLEGFAAALIWVLEEKR